MVELLGAVRAAVQMAEMEELTLWGQMRRALWSYKTHKPSLACESNTKLCFLAYFESVPFCASFLLLGQYFSSCILVPF